MKRRIIYALMGLALVASLGLGFGFASPQRADASVPSVSPCLGYSLGYWYYANQGNEALAEQWWDEGNSYGCGFEVSWNNIW
jgi:hypothetical protein